MLGRRNDRMSCLKHTLPALLLAVWLGATPSARAEVSSENQAASNAAYQAVDALARQTRAQGDLPRWSKPDEAATLGRFWDVPATLGAPPYRATDVPALLTIGARSSALLKTYVMFTPQEGTLPDMAANTFKYQDEIVRAGAYALQVQAAALEALADFVKTLPAEQMNETRRAGLRQVRLGITEQVTGITLLLRSPGIRPENRDLLLDALGGAAAKLAQAATPADRAAMAAQIDAVMPSLTEPERAKAQALKSAYTQQSCVDLCTVN